MKKVKARKPDGMTVVLEDYLQQCLKEAVDKATDDTLRFLCDYIQENWYDKYNPKSYRRTYDFLNSATKTEVSIDNNGYISTLIFFDTNKIIPERRKGEFNAHMSFNGTPISEHIPQMIENGAFFYGRGKENGLGSMEETIKMLQKKFPSMVRKELINMGLKVRFKK